MSVLRDIRFSLEDPAGIQLVRTTWKDLTDPMVALRNE